jgi:hypothetical protein
MAENKVRPDNDRSQLCCGLFTHRPGSLAQFGFSLFYSKEEKKLKLYRWTRFYGPEPKIKAGNAFARDR